LYVEGSAFLAVLLREGSAALVRHALEADGLRLLSGRHTYVEVRRNIARALVEPDASVARDEFTQYWDQTEVVELDAATCEDAADIAERTGVRSLDALHLAAARRAAGTGVTILTLDHRLRDGARSLGISTADIDTPPDVAAADDDPPHAGPSGTRT
jgi:predicted nucleic acid-binding protein